MTQLRLASRAGRALMTATVLGSGVAFLDGSVVNVALPHMARSLHAGFTTMQWVVDAYLLTLGSFVLVGGAVGDVLGRRRLYIVGLAGFGVTSAVCGFATTGPWLIVARGLQGLAGALLVPGSLALITALVEPDERDRAIGVWSGLAGVSGALGPFIGGWLVDAASWRWVFFLNLPLIAVALVVIRRVPESVADATQTDRSWRRLDLPGAALLASVLALVVVPLIEADRLSIGTRAGCFVAAALLAATFVVVEQRSSAPMVPLGLLRSRVFAVANVVTFVIYGALGGAFFLLAVQLQTALGYSALEAGAATAPATLLLLVLSPRVGALLPRIGARPLLTVGPIVAGVGMFLLGGAQPGKSYVAGVLPGLLCFAAGLCLVVTPITATALSSLASEHAGLASGINNAVARVAGLIAVAVLPVLAGTPDGRRLSNHGFRLALTVCAVSCAVGGVLSLIGLARAPDNVAA
jgi:EmrB/QacA subfamily drug resistance transporter